MRLKDLIERSCHGSQRMDSRPFACSFHLYNMIIAVSLLLVSVRLVNKKPAGAALPFNSGKTVLGRAILDRSKSSGRISVKSGKLYSDF